MIALKNSIRVKYDTRLALSIARRVDDWHEVDISKRNTGENTDGAYTIISRSEENTYIGVHKGQELHLRRKIIQDSLPIQRKISTPEEIFTLDILVDGKETYTTSQQQDELRKLFEKVKRAGSRISVARYEVA